VREQVWKSEMNVKEWTDNFFLCTVISSKFVFFL
jgi:hypothetical protein